jgi:hypothetical protein
MNVPDITVESGGDDAGGEVESGGDDAGGEEEAEAACVPPPPIVIAEWTAWAAPMDAGASAIDGGSDGGAFFAGASQPPARGYHAMAWGWIADAGVTLLFGGGNINSGVRADTWTFDSRASTWKSAGSGGPSARGGHALVFAAKSQPTPVPGVFILFGGQGKDFLGDTWTYGSSGQEWLNVCNTANQACGCGPCPRAYHAMAFDPVRNEVLLFGGRDANGPTHETWVFTSDMHWSQQCTGTCTAPSARSEHAMAFDSARGVVVLFGGKAADGTLLNDTWEWNGTQWSKQTPTTSPSARSGHALFASPAGVFLFGGDGASGPAADSLWGWDGTTWTPAADAMPSPSPRAYSALASDAVRSQFLLFGGGDTGELADTWWLKAAVTPPDAGCPTVPQQGSIPASPEAGYAEAGASACTRLNTCCGTIQNLIEQEACLSAVQGASESTCRAALSLLQEGGLCN